MDQWIIDENKERGQNLLFVHFFSSPLVVVIDFYKNIDTLSFSTEINSFLLYVEEFISSIYNYDEEFLWYKSCANSSS